MDVFMLKVEYTTNKTELTRSLNIVDEFHQLSKHYTLTSGSHPNFDIFPLGLFSLQGWW